MADASKSAGLHSGHRQRKREDILKYGVENMREHEVLEVLLYYAIPRMDTNEIAHNLIQTFGSLNKVLNASTMDLCSVKGVGSNTAFFLKMLPGVFKLCEKNRLLGDGVVETEEKLMEYVQSLYSDLTVEALYCICISASKRIVSTKCMAKGTVNKVTLSPAEIIKEAYDKNVAEVAIAHNHPYGAPMFSEEDIIYTHNLANALKHARISLINHFLVAEGRCIKFFK